MAELRLTFIPHEVLGAPTVKKVIITQAKRVVFKLDGRTRILEHRFNNLLNNHSYRFGPSTEYIESATRRGDVITAHYNLFAGQGQTSVYTDFTALPIYHYVGSGETAALDTIGNDVVEVVPTHDDALLAKQMLPRLTFMAHHFIRGLPSVTATRMFSRFSGVAGHIPNPSTNEQTEIRRYDNTCNYYRYMIGFLWRECNRHINRAKTPPEGTAPVKTATELERLVDAFEARLTGQTAHLEHASHAVGARREDSHFIFRWLSKHDEAAWTTKFRGHEIWLADLDGTATELVHDFEGVANNINEDESVNQARLYADVESVAIAGFKATFDSSTEGLGFHEQSIYIP